MNHRYCAPYLQLTRLCRPLSMLFLVFLLSSCATIMQGTTQEVSVSSNPSGADVFINGKLEGRTPLIQELKRKGQHSITVELEGYHPFEIGITRKVSGWVWGNIVFGGIVGLAVDASTGGLYKLDPSVIMAELRSAGSAYLEEDRLLLIVVLEVDPTWEKVGKLEER